MSTATVTSVDPKYGSTTLGITVVLGGAQLDGCTVQTTEIYNDAACTQIVYATDGVTPLTLGQLPVRSASYYAKVTHASHTNYAVANFRVVKTPLTLTVNGGTDLVKIYGDADPTAAAIAELGITTADATQLKNSESITGENSVLKGTLALVSYTNGDNATIDYFTPFTPVTGAPQHVITFGGIYADNYEISYSELKMQIKRRPIADIADDPGTTTVNEAFTSGVTFDIIKTSAVYNGSKQTPNYTMTFAGVAQDVATQLEASFYTENTRTTPADAAQPKDFGTYYVKLAGKGNFTGTFFSNADADKAKYIWDITKAPLLFYAENVEKTYDGLTGLFKYTIDANGNNTGARQPITLKVIATGLVPGDVVTSPAASIDGTDPVKDAKTYTIKLTAPGAGYGNANYNVLPLQNGTFTINKRNVTLKVKDGLTATYGTKPTFTKDDVTIIGAAKYKDADENISTATSGVTNEATAMGSTTDGKVAATTSTTATTDAGPYEDVVTPTYTATATNVFKNYNTPILVTGDLTIEGLTVYIAPLAAEKTYGNADPESFDYTTVGLAKNKVVELIGDQIELTREEGENVGTYTITSAGPASLGNYSFQYMNNYLTINKANLTIVPTTQILQPVGVSEHVADLHLNQNAVTLVGLKKHKDAENNLVNDVIAYTLSLETSTSVVDHMTDAKAQAEGTYANVIKIALGTAAEDFVANQNKNYTIDATALGTLIISTTAHPQDLKLDADGLMAILNANNNAVVNAKIKFNNRTQSIGETEYTWAAEKWNTLVLPFDITIKQLSSTLGYAIVNVVDADHSTTDNVKFKLKMSGKIDANTPFIVKTEDKAADFVVDGAGYVTFNNVTIKTPTSAYPSIKASSDALGYTFVGAYETKNVTASDSYLRFLTGSLPNWAYITNATSSWNIVPFASYVDLTPAAAGREVSFTMEELNGSTTTIRSISTDSVNDSNFKAAEGWYTLNGVKLQGMPTEKGIYINNGKKVVVK